MLSMNEYKIKTGFNRMDIQTAHINMYRGTV